MKSLSLALSLLLISAVASAGDTITKLRANLPKSAANADASAKNVDSRTAENTADDHDLCYSMRVYMFEAKDGESPRPKGVTTCVASNPRILKKADQSAARFKQLK